jgi:hypothetical protein
MEEITDDLIYSVTCDCGWFGMRDDCRKGRCPNCGDKVKRETYNESNKEGK